MNINFTKAAAARYREMSNKTIGLGDQSLDSCISRLMKWDGDGTILISCDFHAQSFYFQETREDGSRGMCGGIIFHGAHDHGGDGSGPTFSVSGGNVEGYMIHT